MRGRHGPQLTPALMALLEHADRAVLNGLLRLAGLDVPAGGEAAFHFPAPDGADGAGEIHLGDRRIWLAAVAPGEEPPPLPAGGAEPVIISPGAPAGRDGDPVHRLSWDRVDRWLGEVEAQYDANTRTGFLVRQFRAYLPEAGIRCFPGFDAEILARAPRAFRDLAEFHSRVEALFEQIGTGFAASWPLLRTARPQDVLAGYWFRDYAGAGKGEDDFVRIALHLEAGELQIAVWLSPGGAPHARLQAALAEEGGLGEALRALTPPPVLRLWSAADERQIRAEELDPALRGAVDWTSYTVAVQVARPLSDLAGEGLPERLAGWTQELLDVLAPVLADVVH